MQNFMIRLITLSLLALGLASTAFADDDSKVSDGEKLFALHVKPLLFEKCLACHGANPDGIEGGLDLRSRSSLLAGGDSFGEEVVIVGDGRRSLLYRTTTREEEGFEMPPKQADQLSEQQQWWIRDWIDAGAPWPDDDRIQQIQKSFAKGIRVSVSRALSDEWQNRRYEPEKLWAYRPIKRAEVPHGQHPVDWFINRKLEK